VSDLKEYLRPWKLVSLAAGVLLLVAGSVYLPAPDWDVPISLIMAACTYVAAPWSLRIFYFRRWRLWPLALLASWFSVDGCYWLYWRYQNPFALEAMRGANFWASSWLYCVCGLLWFYHGSLREFFSEFLRFPKARIGHGPG